MVATGFARLWQARDVNPGSPTDRNGSPSAQPLSGSALVGLPEEFPEYPKAFPSVPIPTAGSPPQAPLGADPCARSDQSRAIFTMSHMGRNTARATPSTMTASIPVSSGSISVPRFFVR